MLINLRGGAGIVPEKKRKFNLQFVTIQQEAECEKSAMDIKYNTDTKIEDNARLYQLQKANFDQEVNTAVRQFFL